MANAIYYSNLAQQTTLSGNISSGAVSITVGATVGFPGSFPYTLALDFGAATEELVSVTNASGTSLTVTRGYGGTSAQSHSVGAVVRHVYNAQDATDFRTHEAATAGVHGVTGALVGVSDTQTLSNKTLTSPTINGAALSGTFTGAPTLSGNVIFSGNPQITGLMQHQRTPSTAEAWEIYISGDANPTLKARTNGTLLWGPGGASSVDTNLYRSAAATLATDSALAVTGELRPSNLVRSARANATDSAYETRVTGDANARWYMRADGQMWWAAGTSGQDTNLYRASTNLLKTDSNFHAANFPSTVGSWTPVWTTGSGLHTPSFGNATVTGRYVEFGMMVFFTLRIVFGSTTNFGGGTTSDNWYFSLPVVAARGDDPCGWFTVRPANNNSSMGELAVVSTDTARMQLNIGTSQPNGSAVANAGSVDAVSPITWSSGDVLVMAGFYEGTS